MMSQGLYKKAKSTTSSLKYSSLVSCELLIKYISVQEPIMPSSTSGHPDQRGVEPHPTPPRNISGNVDYEPHPVRSIPISTARKEIQKSILSLYDGSASEKDMKVYAERAIYDDPFSYCDTRY